MLSAKRMERRLEMAARSLRWASDHLDPEKVTGQSGIDFRKSAEDLRQHAEWLDEVRLAFLTWLTE